MLIRQNQMKELGRSSQEAFEDRLLSHIQEHFPIHWREAGRENLGTVVQKGIADAASHGLETQREIYLYVSLMLYLGSDFHTDFQLLWVMSLLKDPSAGPSARIDKTYDAAVVYLERVAGTNGEHSTAAIRRFLDMIRDPGAQGPGTAAEKLAKMFPQKYRLLNQTQLGRLIEQGGERARLAGLEPQDGGFLCAGLSLLLGHGYVSDPQFTWAGEALKGSGGSDGEKRVKAVSEMIAGRLSRWAEAA